MSDKETTHLYRCEECDEVLGWWGVITHVFFKHTPEGRVLNRVRQVADR